MRVEQYQSLNDILEDSRRVTQSHDNSGIPLKEIPDRLKILGILANQYYEPILSICDRIQISDIRAIDIMPSEFIKAAHNLQLSYKYKQTVSEDLIESAYIKLVNCGIEKRKIITEHLNEHLVEKDCIFFQFKNINEKKKVLYFVNLLRACSEILYFDNHTTVCDNIYSMITGCPIIFKIHKNLFTDYMYKCVSITAPDRFNIYLKYKKFNVEFDMIGNYSSTDNLFDELIGWRVEVDSLEERKVLAFDEMDEYIERYELILKDFHCKYASLPQSESLRLVLKCLYQVNMPIFEYFGIKYDFDETMLSKVVQNYSDTSLLSTEDIFKRYSYHQAIEYIINPKFYFKGAN